TSTGDAASIGTTSYSGVKNIAAKNKTPVVILARPVLAPSPTPAEESAKTVLDETEPTPPATAPKPSRTKAFFISGNTPSLSAKPLALPKAVKVPMASKKFASKSAKT